MYNDLFALIKNVEPAEILRHIYDTLLKGTDVQIKIMVKNQPELMCSYVISLKIVQL